MRIAKLIELFETGVISDKAVHAVTVLNEQVNMGEPTIGIDQKNLTATWVSDRFELVVTVKENDRIAVVCKNLETGETATDHYAPANDEKIPV